ncbi:MAG: hypothetical protein D6743_05695 [Calditrichaeota bacterium]|nr:MAG: hypothetical protein D6743_05695 [Calditrichota bacterium]
MVRKFVVGFILWGLTLFSAGNVRAQSVDSLQVVARSAVAGGNSIYHLTLISPDTLPKDAVLEVTFPPGFDLKPLEVAGSRDMNGGLRLRKNQRTVTLERTGLGAPVPPGKPVTIKLGLIRNPQPLRPDFAVRVQVRTRQAQRTIFDKTVNVRFQTR